MYVVANRSITFLNQSDFKIDRYKAPRQHVLPAGREPQEVPDWVTEDHAFQDAASTGEITVVGFLPVIDPKIAKLAAENVVLMQDLSDTRAHAVDQGRIRDHLRIENLQAEIAERKAKIADSIGRQ